MRKEVIKLLGEITFITLVIIFTYFTFTSIQEKNLKTTQGLLSYSNNIDISNEQLGNNKLSLMSDEEAINTLNEDIINLENKQSTVTQYALYLCIDKTSNYDVNNYRVKVNNDIYYLKDIYSYEDDKNIYYILLNSEINGKKNHKISFLIWVTEDSKIEINNQSLTYNFLVKEK